ncbi:hypothetical protein DXG01_012181 [Tephrocybe rancida]|nr:hypothetical protein DXG01_012181 [Tephrocybe rancida]
MVSVSYPTPLYVNATANFLSCATNLVATTFIAWTMWQQLRFLKKHIEGHKQQLFGTWHILALLVESGAIYGLVQFIFSVMRIAVDPIKEEVANCALYMFSGVYFSISFVYPALTLFIVHESLSINAVHSTVMSLRGSQVEGERNA